MSRPAPRATMGAVQARSKVTSWAAAACFGSLAIGRLAGADQFRNIGAPAAALLPFTPQAAAAAWIAALLAPDHRARAATALAAATLTATLVPRAIRAPSPWRPDRRSGC